MSSISDYHEYLFLGKITDSLSTDEEKALKELFEADPESIHRYEELKNRLPESRVEDSFSNLNASGFWKNVTGEIKQEKRRIRNRNIFRVGGTIVVLAAIFAGTWLIFPTDRKIKSNPLYAKGTESVELKLANGKIINLSSIQGTIDEGNLTLQNHDRILDYKTQDESASGINTLMVPTGMDYKIKLSDGSEIWLNALSTLEFPATFTTDKREITIEGEAYLKIAPNAKKPFLVHLPENTVQVTGTELNVNTYNPKEIKIALVSGGVNVQSSGTTTKINPGMQAISVNGNIHTESFKAKNVLSWQKGLFYFDNANLEELSQVLIRWFGIHTIIDRPGLLNKRFAGVLDKNKPVESFLDNLQVISKIKYYFDKDGILHFS